MITVELTGTLVGVTVEPKTYVDRDTGKVREYTSRKARVLVGSDFVVCSVKDGVDMPKPEQVGKPVVITIIGLENDRDVARATVVGFRAGK